MKVRYNFEGLLEVLDDMIGDYEINCRIKETHLNDLRKELNRFFSDSKCLAVVYTENDGLFFGMCVHPELTPSFIRSVIENEPNEMNRRIVDYRIEIDSKTFAIPGLTNRELLAMLLHEVGHIVNDSTLYEELSDAVSVYAARNHISVKLPEGEKERSLAMSIIQYGFSNAIRKMSSMFCIYKNGEVLADHFVYECGFLDDLQSVFRKVSSNSMNINNTVQNKLVVLTWTLRLIMDIRFKRNTAVHTLMDASRVTQSKFEKIQIKTCIDKLKKYTTGENTTINVYECVDYLLEQDYIEESKEAADKKSARRKAAILRGVAPFEEDYYEYVMQARSLGDKNNAMYVLRQVNQHISVLEDVLESVELSSSEAKKFMALLDKYKELRFDLAHNSKFKYDYSNSVIQISYPEL